MFQSTDLQRMASAFARHAAARQATAAANIAHADTPGYRARVVAPFAETYRRAGLAMNATRAGHFGAPAQISPRTLPGPAGADAAPNGNTVAIETEMMRAAEARLQHDMALGISRTLGGMLRRALGRQG